MSEENYVRNPVPNQSYDTILGEEFNRTRLTGYANFQYQYREYFGEFIGTLILVSVGCGSVAQAVLNPAAKGSAYLTVNLGFAFALMFGIFVAAPISGAHLNPAITFANALLRKFPCSKVPGYILAQTLGGFVGAYLVFLTNYPAFTKLDDGVRHTVGELATAGIFATFSADYVSFWQAFVIEIIGTAYLVLGILGITDSRHGTPAWIAPFAIGGVLGSIGMTLGWLTGFALNPARDLGPRLFLLVAGWGTEPFTHLNHYFLVPTFAPFVGAYIGILAYDTLVGQPLPPLSETEV